MTEPVEEQVVSTEEIVIEQQETISEQVEKVTDSEEIVAGQPESTSISPPEETEMPCVVESVQEVVPKAKSVRGRRAKTAEPSEENIQAQFEETEAPVRAKRGRKAETSAPEQTTRSRNAKSLQEPVQAESVAETPVKQKRGRLAKKPSKEVPEEAQTLSTGSTAEPQTESEHVLPTADQEVEQSSAPEEPVVKPTLDGLSEVEKVIETNDIVEGQPDTTSISLSVSEEVAPKAKSVRGRRAKPAEPSEQNKQAQTEETVAPVRARRGRKIEASAPEQTARSLSAETLEEPVHAEPPVKQRRGRLTKKPSKELPKEVPEEAQTVSTESTAEPQTESEHVLPTADQEAVAPVRGRRGKKTEVPPAAALKQKRGHAGKAEEKAEDKVIPEETQQINVTTPEQADDKTCAPAITEEMVQGKTKRGRKTKAPIEPEPETAVVEANPVENAQPELSVPNKKPQRGRRAKIQAEPPQPEPKITVQEAEPSPEPEIITAESLPVEEAQPEQPVPAEKPKRMKRGRTTEDSKSTEESLAPVPEKKSCISKPDPKEKTISTSEPKSTETAKRGQTRVVPNEPVKSGRRAAKANSDPVEVEPKGSSDGIEDIKTSKKSVKWNSFVEVKDVTPLRTVRGRKTKPAENIEEPQNVLNSEEKKLAENTQPAKRTRRGAKAAEESTNTTLENKDTETQPKGRKGRSAKK